MMNCYDSRRMRQALAEFRDAGGSGDEPGDVDGEDAEDMEDDDESLAQRVAALEEENRGLREFVEGQARQLEELGRRVAALEGREPRTGAPEAVNAGDDQKRDWRPPRRRPGMPDVGVTTLEEQPDEAHAFGPAAPLVAEWREITVRVRDGSAGSRVDRAVAAVRRWELETEMLRDFHLTLPPEKEPLHESRRKDHVRWREESLSNARRELSRAKRARLLLRLLMLGLWRK